MIAVLSPLVLACVRVLIPFPYYFFLVSGEGEVEVVNGVSGRRRRALLLLLLPDDDDAATEKKREEEGRGASDLVQLAKDHGDKRTYKVRCILF